jgi:transposase
MPNFIPYDYNQSSMVVINYLDQLQPGTFEHAIHFLISNKLDLSVYFSAYNNSDNGRPAYDPAILLKIILFAYSKGITSSREIQWCCETNIIFKALSCDTVPHYTTIASFVSGHTQAIEELFEQILFTCGEQGLLGHELFAIDGCKMSSNASKEVSGTFKELEQKRDKIKKLIKHHIKEHQQLDKDEPREEARIKRAKQAAVTLTAAFDKIDKFLKTSSPRMGKGQEHHTLQPVLETIKGRYKRLGFSENIYKDNIIVTAYTGFANEANNQYMHENNINGYVPDNRFRSRDPKFANQKTKYGKRTDYKKTKPISITPASEFNLDPRNKSCTCPAGESLWLKNEGIDKRGNYKLFFEGRLSKCRHCTLKKQCMTNPDSANTRSGHGRQVSFILGNKRAPNFTDWMKHRVDSDKGKLIYSHRMSVVEPVFGNIGTNKGLSRFSLRGKQKVQGQWKLFCIVHNIEKLMNYGTMAA